MGCERGKGGRWEFYKGGYSGRKRENHSSMLNILQSNKGKMDEAKKKGAGAGNAR